MLGSLGVMVAALVLIVTGWAYADAVIAAAIGLFVLPRAWQLARSALRVLLEIAPPNLDVRAVHDRLSELPGVKDVHDLHIWTITSGYDVASGHLTLDDHAEPGITLRSAIEVLRGRFAIAHVTLQLESPGATGCASALRTTRSEL
jgi:cobalt-zinc-cadmium efflux system protein